MSLSPDPKLDARLLDDAAEWVLRVHASDADEADWLALETWLGADPRHGGAYDAAETIWVDLDRQAVDIGRALATKDADAAVIDLAERRVRRAQPRWVLPAALAAAILVTVGLFGALSGPRVEVYDTAPGEIRAIALDDGTRIHLNGASHIEVRMGRKTREVDMAQAEASFDVAHDARRPFVVAVGEDQVRVVGTEFNIRRSPVLTTVTVRRGVVEVRPGTAAGPIRLPAGTSYERADSVPRANIRKVSPDAAFAWRTGQLVYDNAPLSRVVADLGRRFQIPIVVDNAAGKLRFTGVLLLDDEAKVVARLEAFLPVTAHRTADRITLTSKAKVG